MVMLLWLIAVLLAALFILRVLRMYGYLPDDPNARVRLSSTVPNWLTPKVIVPEPETPPAKKVRTRKPSAAKSTKPAAPRKKA
jgi:hypothetical protein